MYAGGSVLGSMIQEYPIWLVDRHMSAVSPCCHRVGASSLRPQQLEGRRSGVSLTRCFRSGRRFARRPCHRCDPSTPLRQCVCSAAACLTTSTAGGAWCGKGHARWTGRYDLRRRGAASGLLPQRTNSAMPRISTYSARLVCRVLGLREQPAWRKFLRSLGKESELRIQSHF